jgi:hypothetical protein
MITYIHCINCGKVIEKKGNREYCIPCRNRLDKELAEIRRKENREEIRERDREWYNLNRKAH